MEDGHKVARDSISRRSVIKRIGAGAAIAWSAPVLQSLSAPAHAQYGGECTQCAGDFCFGQTICGNSGPTGVCGCAQPVGSEGGGTCFCYEDDFCTNRTQCSSQADCPSGQTCTHTCCDDLGSSVCFSPCGTNATSESNVSSGPRGTRR